MDWVLHLGCLSSSRGCFLLLRAIQQCSSNKLALVKWAGEGHLMSSLQREDPHHFVTSHTGVTIGIYETMETLALESVYHGKSLTESQEKNKKLWVTHCTSLLLPQLTPNRLCLGWSDLVSRQGQSHTPRIKIAKYAYLSWITFGGLIIWIYCFFNGDSSTGENFKMHHT